MVADKASTESSDGHLRVLLGTYVKSCDSVDPSSSSSQVRRVTVGSTISHLTFASVE